MKYVSTRDGDKKEFSSAFVIKKGLADDGGLFVPTEIPELSLDDIAAIAEMDYPHRAAAVLNLFLDDYSFDELLEASSKAYSEEKFGASPAPISKVGDNYFLELWHGPTSAFKDMALQIMPRMLSLSLGKTGEDKNALILVATSGDTGKAALEGYKDIDRVGITVFYPSDGVSNIQKKQMASQDGKNVDVIAIKGNFDDAQTGVKKIFSDSSVRETLAEKGLFLSSANSINFGRLAPQIVYYISAYCDLVNEKELHLGDTLDVTVPTGNFGNILACYIAKKMGLPIGKMICASNSNDVLTEFFETGVYDTKKRKFVTTVSPSMDILVSSNLERLIWFLSGEKVAADYAKGVSEGRYEYKDKALLSDFKGYSCSEENTAKTIKSLFTEFAYLCDTHTAVAAYAAGEYKKQSENKMLIVSTASPYKFAPAVLKALGESVPDDDFDSLDKLFGVTGVKIPENLSALRDKKNIFNTVISPEEMKEKVLAKNK